MLKENLVLIFLLVTLIQGFPMSYPYQAYQSYYDTTMNEGKTIKGRSLSHRSNYKSAGGEIDEENITGNEKDSVTADGKDGPSDNKNLFLVSDFSLNEDLNDLVNNDTLGPPLTEEDIKITESERSGNVKPMPLNPDLFEGDILGVKLVSRSSRGGYKNSKKWPDGVIPYVISNGIDSSLRSTISRAIDLFKQRTCVKFVPRESQHNSYIHILRDQGCYSHMGLTPLASNGQVLSLGYGCEHLGTVMHEMLHAAGFIHEQGRTDRDNHVRILYENISKGMQSQFTKYTSSQVDLLGLPYEYGSVMHYHNTAFSSNRRPTIEVLDKNYHGELGNRRELTDLDYQKLSKFYNCEGNNNGGSTSKPTDFTRRTTTGGFTRRTTTGVFTKRTTTSNDGSGSQCVYKNTMYKGYNIVMGPNNIQRSWQDCQKSCQSHSMCKYWTWAFGMHCYLKTDKREIRPVRDHISGPVRC